MNQSVLWVSSVVSRREDGRLHLFQYEDGEEQRGGGDECGYEAWQEIRVCSPEWRVKQRTTKLRRGVGECAAYQRPREQCQSVMFIART